MIRTSMVCFFSGNLLFLLSVLRKSVLISLLDHYQISYELNRLFFSHIAVYCSKNSLLSVKKRHFSSTIFKNI